MMPPSSREQAAISYANHMHMSMEPTDLASLATYRNMGNVLSMPAGTV